MPPGCLRFLGLTADGRRRWSCGYDLPPIMGGSGGDPIIDDQVNANLDDVFEREDTGAISDGGTLQIIYAATVASSRYWGGFRFHNGPFPAQGDTVDVAYIQLYTFTNDYADVDADIYAEDTASPPTFTLSNFNVSSRTRTTSSAGWSANALGIGWKQSPSIVSVIQELVDSYSPTAIVLIGKPRTVATKQLSVRPHNYDPTLAAKLHLEWTEAGVGGLAAFGVNLQARPPRMVGY